MNPQQVIIALAGLALVAFRLFTSQQRQALATLWNGPADSTRLGNGLGNGAGGLLLPPALGVPNGLNPARTPPPQLAPLPPQQDPAGNLAPTVHNTDPYRSGGLAPGITAPSGPATNHNPLASP